MQDRRTLSAPRIDQDLLRFVLRTPRWFWVVTGLLGIVVAAAVVSVATLIVFGLGELGYTNTVYWSVFITNFVFWIEISHAGVLMSALLRLVQADWRRPITRAAETLAIFGLSTAGLFAILHTGRAWRTLYWFLPYDFTRNLWPNVRSALIWDPSAIATYLIATTVFVAIGLVPDAAVLRDRSTGFRRRFYSLVALGFRGTPRQWRVHHVGSIILSALILPVFVSVTSIVSWDFAMASLPGWHSTGFGPYFVIGAVHSGIAAVVTVIFFLRWAMHLEDYFTLQIFDTLGRAELVVLLGYLFFFLTDAYFDVSSGDPVSLAIWQLRLFTPPVNLLFGIQVVTSILVPIPVWLSPRLRRTPVVMAATAVTVNVGMWLEHYLLIVTPLNYKQPFVFTWVAPYTPRLIEYIMTFGGVALVALGIVLFAKLFPIVPVANVKAGQIRQARIRVGRVEVPAVVHE